MQPPDFLSYALGWLAYEFAKLQPLIPTYVHLIVSAMLPIYAGAHSSLSRPSSAAKSDKNSKRDDDDADDDEEEPLRMEGLSPTDAILFPIMAGTTLAGLYFLLKWLQDPAILNKILNWYFATFSVFSVSRLVSDALDVLHSLGLPHDYVDRGVLFHVDARVKRALPVSSNAETPRQTPLPGFLSRLPLPKSLTHFLWVLHVLPNRKLTFKAFLRGLGRFKAGLGIHGIEGLSIGLASVLYYNFVSKPWWLTNLMGFGFAYGSLQILSPTTFWTGTLILSGLFFYDIYFVFYTPMMVTVAKSLDIPIKLLFPRPPPPGADPTSRGMSMLGLGDVVLPGIMIGLALRFDLYMFYLKKQTNAPPNGTVATAPDKGPGSPRLDVEDAASKQITEELASAADNDHTTTDSTPKDKISSVVKAPYRFTTEGWGDRLWTWPLPSGQSTGYIPRGVFPKPYFHASLVGYFLGMLATLGVMQVFEHAQPALLYLVPGVLSSLWMTAWVRGEVGQMWEFSDAAQDDESGKNGKEEEKKIDEKSAKNEESLWEKITGVKSFFSTARLEERAKNLEQFTSKHVKGTNDEDGRREPTRREQQREKRQAKKHGGAVFSLSIIAPEIFPESTAEKTRSGSTRKKHNSSQSPAGSTDEASSESEEEVSPSQPGSPDVGAQRWNTISGGDKSDEHSGKRQRLE